MELNQLARDLLRAERPLFLVGHGLRVADAGEKFLKTVLRFEIPFVFTSHLKGYLPEDIDLNFGPLGFACSPEIEDRIRGYRPDIVVALGTRLGEASTMGWSDCISSGTRLYQVLNDPADFNKAYPEAVRTTCDLHDLLACLWRESGGSIATSEKENPADYAVETKEDGITWSEAGPMNPISLVKALEKLLPEGSLLVSDIGNSMAWAIRHMKFTSRLEHYVPLGLGSMGSGIGAAIGAKLVQPERPVFCLAGDCAMVMYGNEILTAREQGAGVVFLVLNDGGHGMVDHGHRLIGLPNIRVRFDQPVNFKIFGEAFSLEAHQVETLADLKELPWESWRSSKAPVVVDMSVDRTVEPPIKARARVLGQGNQIERPRA